MKPKKKVTKSNYGTISLPMPLIEKIKEKIKGTGMNSVSAYVTFILRQLLSSTEGKPSREIIDKESEQEIKKRLKSLGYY